MCCSCKGCQHRQMMGKGSMSAGIRIERGGKGGVVSFEWIGDDVEDYTNERKYARGVNT